MKLFDFNPTSNKPLLHLAHANGFPPETYRRAVEPLLAHYHVVCLLARPLWGTTPPEWLKSWSQMADDLIEGLEEIAVKNRSEITPHPNPLPQGARELVEGAPRSPSPLRGEGRVRGGGVGVVAVGHSLGAVTTLYAAVKRPELFSHVVLIDPTMLSPKFLWQIKFMKLIGWESRKFLVQGALRRKREWGSAQEAYDYFRGRQLFKNWSDETVKAYTDSMTAPSTEGGVYLIYPPEWEAQIYRTIPTDVWKFAPKLAQPTLVIRGESSNTFTADSEKAFRKANPRAEFQVVPDAGHLVAQEKPEVVGGSLLKFLEG